MSNEIIIGIVSLYNPSLDNIKVIKNSICFVNHFIIMDDSETSCKPVLEKYFDLNSVDYYWNEGNVGLCKSLNFGLKKAIEKKPNWILILDQDSKLHSDVINIYREFLRDNAVSDIALIAPLYNYDRHKRTPVDRTRSIPYADLSGCLYNVNAFLSIGLYDERYFTYCMDREWCLRARKRGYKLVECGKAVIDHHPAHTKELRFLGKVIYRYGQDTPQIYYYQFRGHLLLHDEYHDISTDFFGIYKWLKANLLFDNKTEYREAWKKAKADYRRGFFGKYNS